MLKTMKVAGLVVLALALCSPMSAQVIGDDSLTAVRSNGPGVYQLNYFSNAQRGAEQFVRIVNPGTAGHPLSPNEGRVCANIYVFDAVQEMLACCECELTANDLAIVRVKADLLIAPLTGDPGPNNGVIKIVSSDASQGCDARAIYPKEQLLAWGTHLQEPINGVLVTTETAFTPAKLSSDEKWFLETACQFVLFLGTGRGVCSCPNDELPGHAGG